MDIFEALEKRKSIRAFLPKEVEKEKIQKILDYARLAPSAVNTQPWLVYALKGKAKTNLEEKMIKAFFDKKERKMDYSYYPDKWNEPYATRRKEMGLMMYKVLGISKEDKERQLHQWSLNYKAFEAPWVLYFFIDSNLKEGSYMDYGMFLQSLMLCATSLGLATCPQAALAEYPNIVRKELNISKDKHLLCGIALGYEDKENIINSFKTPRAKVEEFTNFLE